MKTATVTLPTYLASALINGDLSGLDTPEDQLAYEAACELAEGGSYVDCSEESWFSWSNDLPGAAGSLGSDVAEFTILFP